MKESAHRSHQRISAALANGGKRAAMAQEVGISEGQLSKLINGELRRICQLLDELGLEVYPTEYVQALRSIVREEI